MTSSGFGVADLSKPFDPEDFDRRMKEVYLPSFFSFAASNIAPISRYLMKSTMVRARAMMKSQFGIQMKSSFQKS